MPRLITLLLVIVWLASAAHATELPQKGRLLVATEQVQGDVFSRTVILLLHYGDDGAMGIVVNRPTDVPLDEVMPDADTFDGYEGTLFWGGPVQMDSLWSLIRRDEVPEGANTIVGNVHHVPIDDVIGLLPAGPDTVRLYIGYAGWAPGQLDGEMARGDWQVVSATDESVFAEDPQALWERLAPRTPEYSVRRQALDERRLGLLPD